MDYFQKGGVAQIVGHHDRRIQRRKIQGCDRHTVVAAFRFYYSCPLKVFLAGLKSMKRKLEVLIITCLLKLLKLKIPFATVMKHVLKFD